MKQKTYSQILAISLLLTITLPMLANGEQSNSDVDILSVTTFKTYDTLFVAQTEGWLGSDAAHSIILSEDRILWLFGDTYIELFLAWIAICLTFLVVAVILYYVG